VNLEALNRRLIVPIVSGLDLFLDGTRGRRVLLELADLEIFAGGNLDGHPGAVAGDLVRKLEGHGRLEADPTRHALGALLSYVITLRDLPPDSAKCLASIVVKYSLVSDSAYVAGLRSRFGI